ncbi:MAG: hypothetical protein IJI61_07295, partial [Oscillospiraceae bacterium]|nr:hypothetical protein [Oscillospiraceae bacterium]
IVKPEALCYDETSWHEAFSLPFCLVIHPSNRLISGEVSRQPYSQDAVSFFSGAFPLVFLAFCRIIAV